MSYLHSTDMTTGTTAQHDILSGRLNDEHRSYSTLPISPYETYMQQSRAVIDLNGTLVPEIRERRVFSLSRYVTHRTLNSNT